MTPLQPDAPGTAPTPAAVPVIRTSLLLLGYFGFISLGLPDGLLGVGWPSIADEFGVATDTVGILLFAGTAGYLVSSVAAGFSIARLGVGRLLAGSTALASLALTGYALAPSLGFLVPCALIAGLGGGAIDSGLNAYAAGAFGPKHMNWLHAFFGLGVAIGPLIMTAVLSSGLSWHWGYGIVASGQALLAVAFAVSAKLWTQRGPGAEPQAVDPQVPIATAAPIPIAVTLSIPAVWLSAAMFAVYVAIEIAAGLWAFLLLTEGRGLGPAVAGVCVSAYWASLFVGRVVQGFVVERLGTVRILVGSLLGMLAGSALIAVPGPGWLAVIGLMVVGFAAAPVFPLLMLTTADRVGAAHVDRVVGVQIGASGLGGALLPAGVGVLINRFGEDALGLCLVLLSLILLGLYAATRRPAARAAVADSAP
ncbi:fucose permease [Allocatelliglobosispora scoriae]|uniref:Fucose permease n=1 Tax=Allocatelliglobosispora scoriae TaxID=643052 RepID=A0A841BM10_9ACTN|nr:MFS transporter [Allocatelliglobosispora scoriae]MBB5867901.1 fucose permease [Allocatelliglobosispora scoriae]